MGGFAVLSGMLLTVTVRMARRMMRDIKIGKLLIVRRRMSLRKTWLKPDEAGELMTVEILPMSRRLWTQDGKPAPWRTASVANTLM